MTCAYGAYNNEFMPEIVQEIVRDYDVDAVFANRWQGHGVCYCESCRTQLPRLLRPRPAAETPMPPTPAGGPGRPGGGRC